MENICHTLTGLALARGGLARTTPLATTALVVGANLPDIDLAWSSFHSALAYFHLHRGFTHSIAGFFVLAILWWLTLLALDRWLPARDRGRARPLALLGAAAIGVGSHILMDAANTYGIRPYLPWSNGWVYGDIWVIVDPWLWLLLGGAIYFSGAGGRRREAVWLMAAAVAACIVLLASGVPGLVRASFAAALALTVASARRARARPPERRLSIARAGLVLAGAYALLCAAGHHAALGRTAKLAAAHPDWGAVQIAALPHPADPLRWEGIIVSGSAVRYGAVGALPFLDRPGDALSVLPRGLDLDATRSLMRTCAGAVIEEFFRFPCAAIEDGPDGGRVLVVRDARYTRRGRGFAVYVAPLDAAGQPIVDRKECP